jgi:predicted nuclease with TOPRIM domain
MPLAKTGTWGPAPVERPGPGGTTFAGLVAQQMKIARSANEVSTTLSDNLALTNDVVETRAMVFNSVVPMLQAHEALVRQLNDRVAKLEQKTELSTLTREVARLSEELGAVADILEALEKRFEALVGRIDAMDNRLAGVEMHCGALEAETEEIEAKMAKAKTR